MLAYIRAGERPAIKRPPRTWRAGDRAGRQNCARLLGRAYANHAGDGRGVGLGVVLDDAMRALCEFLQLPERR
jgi:hypothetical protein